MTLFSNDFWFFSLACALDCFKGCVRDSSPFLLYRLPMLEPILRIIWSLICSKNVCLLLRALWHLYILTLNFICFISVRQLRAFSVAGPTVWNSLPNFIRDPTISLDCFRGCLKLICSLDTSAFSALEILTTTALYKFTYLLTYLYTCKIFNIRHTGTTLYHKLVS